MIRMRLRFLVTKLTVLFVSLALDLIAPQHSKKRRQNQPRLAGHWCVEIPLPFANATTLLITLRIGFQGNDPATDFRGAGLLGLQNLVGFIQTYPKSAQKIFDAGNLPVALTGLQITALITGWMAEGLLEPHFFYHGSDDLQFIRLYGHIFVAFWHAFSNSGAKTIMDFPPVWRAFCSSLGYHLEHRKSSAFDSSVLLPRPEESP